MKTAFQWLCSKLTKLWRTVVCTFCRKHIYMKDVDADLEDELVIDFNGREDIRQSIISDTPNDES